MSLLQNALKKLEQSDLKVTARRISIIELLYAENRYLSATEVKTLLNKDYPGISPDTIYRNLDSFSEMAIIEVTEFSGEKFFRANCGHEHHHHFICTDCGYTKELSTCPLIFYEDEINESQIMSHRFELFGLCKNCT